MVRHAHLWVWIAAIIATTVLALLITLLLRRCGWQMRGGLARHMEAVEEFLEDLWEQTRRTSRKVWLFIKRCFQNLALAFAYVAMAISVIWEKVQQVREQGWSNISPLDAVLTAVAIVGSLLGLAKEWRDTGSDNATYLSQLAVRLSERLTEVLQIPIDVAIFARRGRRFVWATGSDFRFQSQVWTCDQYPVGTHEGDSLFVCPSEDLIPLERFGTYRSYRNIMERKRARGMLSEDQWAAICGLQTLITYELRDRRGARVGRYVLYSEQVLTGDLNEARELAEKVQFVLDYYADAITLRLV